jgi:hypothetical protein
MKRDGLRSKTDVAMVNETLCSILCHNLVVLIGEMCELGIVSMFWPRRAGILVGPIKPIAQLDTQTALCAYVVGEPR